MTKTPNLNLFFIKELNLSGPKGLNLPKWIPYTFKCKFYFLLQMFAFHPMTYT